MATREELGPEEQRHPTAQAILEAAMADLEERGEGSIRITKVLERSGAAYGSLYHHFGSRENLVKEAIVERYLRSVERGLATFAQAAAAVETKAELIALLEAELQRYATGPVAEQRRQRIAALGGAATRPDILAAIGAAQSRYFDAAGAAIERLRRRGLVDPELDTRAFAAWYLGVVLSRFLVDIDPAAGAAAGWEAMTRAAVLELLKPRDPA